MLQFLKLSNLSQIQIGLNEFNPEKQTWIVSDLKSKHEIQNLCLNKFNYYTDDSILRIQPVSFVYYLSYFILGVVAYKENLFQNIRVVEKLENKYVSPALGAGEPTFSLLFFNNSIFIEKIKINFRP